MNFSAPNLYHIFGVDPADDCTALGILLAGKSAMLEQTGWGQGTARQLQIAYGILSDQTRRAIYDDALGKRPMSWEDLEYLANFGVFPPFPQQQPHTHAQPQTQTATLGAQQPTPSSLIGPDPATAAPPMPVPMRAYAPAAVQRSPEARRRPDSNTRMGMAIADTFIASFIAAMMAAPFGDDGAWFIVFSAVMAAAFIIAEVLLGGTPAKLICGYEVRDVATGKRLSWQQSAKRNWWRLAAIIPGLGTMVSWGAALGYAASINDKNQLRGAHDRFANAEVVRKSSSQ